MDAVEQGEWLEKHIPHRIRAAIALLDMRQSILQVGTYIEPPRPRDEDGINWRCVTDSVWEGRLTATRWLIEFVGVKQDDSGIPVVCKKKSRKGAPSKDVRIDDLDGGTLLNPSMSDGTFLAEIWKGCSQASSHATNEYNHPPVVEKYIVKALAIIVDHLQSTVYSRTGRRVRDFVLRLP